MLRYPERNAPPAIRRGLTLDDCLHGLADCLLDYDGELIPVFPVCGDEHPLHLAIRRVESFCKKLKYGWRRLPSDAWCIWGQILTNSRGGMVEIRKGRNRDYGTADSKQALDAARRLHELVVSGELRRLIMENRKSKIGD